MVLEALISNLSDLSVEFLCYDTGLPNNASKQEIIDWILGLYQRPPDPKGDWTVYLLTKIEDGDHGREAP
jgi:hypothetical protein